MEKKINAVSSPLSRLMNEQAAIIGFAALKR